MGIFTSSTTTCPALPTPVNGKYQSWLRRYGIRKIANKVSDAAPISGSLTFNQLSIYIAGPCMGVVCLISISLMLLHATHLSIPAEQTKIIRITALIPIYAIIQFATIYLGTSAIYLLPWMNFFESIALITFVLLVCDYLSPNVKGQNGYVDVHDSSSANDDDAHGVAMAMSQKVRRLAAQYIAVATLVAIATDITQATGVYCNNSNSVHFAHIWLTIIRAVSSAVAIVAIIKFTTAQNRKLPRQRIMFKLVAFKLIVFLNLLQTIIFSFVGARVTPTATFSYLDLTVSLPAIIYCFEMVIFSVVFHFAYSFRPYIINKSSNSSYQGGALGVFGIAAAFNPVDLVREIVDEI
ncbi:hypothetical protein MMC34_004953 [Xylographa carneopallida]|nr:hypothetical protein [Xylographa carneopallida]